MFPAGERSDLDTLLKVQPFWLPESERNSFGLEQGVPNARTGAIGRAAKQESAPMRAPHVLLVDFLYGDISEGRGLRYCATRGPALRPTSCRPPFRA